MTELITYAIDLAKDVFQVAFKPSADKPIEQKRLKRAGFETFLATALPGRVVMEACSFSHHWARTARAAGHQVKLLSPAAVRAFANQKIKNDARDALAILAADGRADLKPVAVKSCEQQSWQALISTCEGLVRERIRLRNKIRAQLAEQGVFAPVGGAGFATLKTLVRDPNSGLPVDLAFALGVQLDVMDVLETKLKTLEARVRQATKASPMASNLMAVPGIGPRTALMLVARVADPKRFSSGKAFVSWLGLAPGEDASGNRKVQTPVTCKGDKALRAGLVRGATAVVQHTRAKTLRSENKDPWLEGLLARRKDLKPKQVAVALAGRIARQALAMMITGECWLNAQERCDKRKSRTKTWEASRASTRNQLAGPAPAIH